ncbi:S-type anion channel SLAH2-like isoform X1 [Carex littledalei]|uniref:S-type anion channel SLAH2-like isoform X1 n=1 Tax=Carex littledalei TaxID=544730 RepID=A0A833QL63_9POAL|nr:S-type anion channel SLAH2-like isoform X1 [Carex littledalei]
MEKNDLQVEIPSVLKQSSCQNIRGFDCVDCENGNDLNPLGNTTSDKESNEESVASSENTKSDREGIVIDIPSMTSLSSLSLSLPSSPSGLHIGQTKLVVHPEKCKNTNQNNSLNLNPQLATQKQYRSLPILLAERTGRKLVHSDTVRDSRFDPFKTWSGKLERKISNLRGKPTQEEDLEAGGTNKHEIEEAPGVDRYFDALEGPELDILRATEVSVLPEDEKWPFLLRFPVNAFGMCLGVSSQAILWKTLNTSPVMSFLHISPMPNLILWWASLVLMVLVSFVYLLKIVFYFEAVKREYDHPVRVNFFFAPWIACLFLTLGVPPSIAVNLQPFIWYILMAPILLLELKIYGQWISNGQRRLSKVANPSNHLSIVGNFVGALLGANMGLKEGPIFFFAVGLAHYMVLFVTLYQRLPTNETLPKELHPVFFLFVAAPSVACMAWAKIQGDFDYGAKIPYFIALFLYMSLAVRVNFFRGFRFSLSWWAYTFPMTGASIATITYTMAVTNIVTRSLSLCLSAISTFTVSTLLVYTIIHAFVLRDLFPNDISIAITKKKPKFRKMLAQFRSSSSDSKDFDSSIAKGLEF